MIKAIFFDVFGTLVDWRTSIIRIGEDISKKKGYSLDWEDFVIKWRLKYLPALKKINENKEKWKNLDIIHKNTLEEVLEEMNIKFLTDVEKNELVYGWHKLDPWNDSCDAINTLKNSFITASLSNGGILLQKKLTKYAELNFDILFSAEHFKKYKPEEKVYTQAIKYLDLKRNECVLVASHKNDLMAASKLGLKTIFIERKLEYGKFAKNFQEQEFLPDIHIKSLKNLKDSILKLATRI